MTDHSPGASLSPHAHCDRCGRCLSVCPVYQQSLVETDSPRGRADLTAAVISGELKPGPRFAEIVDRCLLCRACASACPKGVNTPAGIIQARADRRVRGFAARLGAAALDALVAHRGLMAAGVHVAGLFARGLPLDETGGRHFPEYLPRLLAGRGVPAISTRPLRNRFPILISRTAGSPKRGQAVLFSGCYHGLVEPAPAVAAVRLLSLNGFDVVIPPGQQCCGAPALFGGRLEGFRAALAKNLRVLAGVKGLVVSACPTCASVLRGDYPAEAARMGGCEVELSVAVAGRVHEVLTLLADLDSIVLPAGAPGVRNAAVHQPCHFVHAGGDGGAVARLLGRCGVAIALNQWGSCCGGGGLSSLKNPDLAYALGRAVAETVAASRADAALSACPGCVLQIGSHLGRLGCRMPALHPLEILYPREEA